MKLTIKENNQDGYLYITKHGLGPGTLPKGITVLREEELDNYLTVFWTDRFLTTKELNEYDIYPETMNNTILNRYGMTYNSFGENKERCNNKKLSINDSYQVSTYGNDSTIKFLDVDGAFGNPGNVVTYQELKDRWNENKDSDPCLADYDTFMEWWTDTNNNYTIERCNESINSEPEYYYDDKDVKKECKEYMIMKKLKIKESFENRLYTRKELLNLISSGMGIDADNISKDELPVDYKILGHSEGTYGITGGVIEDNQTGDWYVFTKRTPNLFKIF